MVSVYRTQLGLYCLSKLSRRKISRMYFKWLSYKVHILIDIEYYGETQDLGILKPLRTGEFYSNKKTRSEDVSKYSVLICTFVRMGQL